MGFFRKKQLKEVVNKSFNEGSGNFYVVNGSSLFGVNDYEQSDLALIDTYNNVPELSGIINYTANVTARIPHKIVRLNNKGEQEIIQKPEIEKLLAKPNQNQNGIELKKQNIVLFMLLGNCYINLYAPSTIKKILRLYSLPPQYVNLIFEQMENGRINPNADFRTNDVDYYQLKYGTSFESNIDPLNIIHFKDTNITFANGGYAKGFSRAHSSIMATKSLRQGYEAKYAYYKNRGAMGMLVNRAENGVHVSPEEKNRILNTFKNKFGLGRNQNLVEFSQQNLDYLNITPDLVALQIPENNELDFRTLCKGLGGFPSVLLNDNRTATYNNVKEAQIMLYTNLSIPIDMDYNENLTIGFRNVKMLEPNEFILSDISNIEALQVNAKDNETVKVLKEKWSGLMYTRNSLTTDEYRNINGFDPDAKLTQQRQTDINNKLSDEKSKE